MDETPEAARLRRERDDKAQQLAINRAIQDDRVTRQLEAHDSILKKHDHEIARLTNILDEVKQGVQRLENYADAASRNASTAISNRSLWIAVAAVLVPVVILLFRSTGHA